MSVSPEDLAAAVRAAVARPDVHALVVVYVPIIATTGLPHAAALRSAISEATMPVLTTFPARRRQRRPGVGAVLPDAGAGGGRAGPRGAVRLVADQPGRDGPRPARDRHRRGPHACCAALRQPDDPARALTDAELTRLLDCYGIPLLEYRAIGNATEAVAAAEEIGYPVALKSFDDSLRHRMDHEGVRLGLVNAEQVMAAYDELSSIAGPWLDVQAMAPRDRADVSTVFAIRPTRPSACWSRSGSAAWRPSCSTTGPTGPCR